MNLKNIISTAIMFLAIVAISTLFFMANNNDEKLKNERPSVLSMTASVDAPKDIVFANEKTIFDRYDLYERIDRELNSFTYFHSTTLLLIKRANRFFPIIEPILKQQGVPDDMKYLAAIESNLFPRAVSPAKAAGLWQFMPSTAKMFGLEINHEVDERYNVEKSTIAACKYLKKAHEKYNSWQATAIAYNGGMGRITNELNKQQTNSAADLWLVEETSRYYFRMLAIKIIFENPQKFGFVIKPHQLYKPIDFKRIETAESIPNLAYFAKKNGITYAQLKDFNSWLRDRKLVNKSHKTYTILIPKKESLYYRKGEKIRVHNNKWVTK